MKIDFLEIGEKGYAIIHAESCHIPFLNAIEFAVATIFLEHSLPEYILSEKHPMDALLEARERGML